MRILDVTAKDLFQVVRDWRSAMFLLAAPVIFTVLMGVMMGGLGGAAQQDPRLPVGVLDRDGGIAAAGLIDLLEESDALKPVLVEEKDSDSLEEQVSRGTLAAAVVIPAGYTRDLLDGRDVPLRWMVNDQSAAGTTATQAFRAAMFRLLSSAQTARWSAEIVEAAKGFDSSADRTLFLETALQSAVREWNASPVTVEVRSAAARDSEQQIVPTGFAQASPGNMVTFALAGLIGAAEILVWERKSGTLQRLLTTSISRWEILIGHFLAMFMMVFLQVILLAVFGQLLFGLAYWNAPLAFLVAASAVTFWIASMGLLIGVIARTPEQISMMAIVPMLVLAGLGGAWMPLEVTGKTFQDVGHLTPTYWAMTGMQNLILRGQGLPGVLLPSAVLCGFGLAFLGIAVWKFAREQQG